MKPAMGIFDKWWLYFKFDGSFSSKGTERIGLTESFGM
jgi:hypothetical protein